MIEIYGVLVESSYVIEAKTCCHFVTLNKIYIHNTSCVLTCESVLLIYTTLFLEAY